VDVAVREFERMRLETKRQLEIVEDFQRIDPSLERPVLVAEDRRLASNYVEERPGLSSSRELEAALRQGELWKASRRRVLGPRFERAEGRAQAKKDHTSEALDQRE